MKKDFSACFSFFRGLKKERTSMSGNSPEEKWYCSSCKVYYTRKDGIERTWWNGVTWVKNPQPDHKGWCMDKVERNRMQSDK